MTQADLELDDGTLVYRRGGAGPLVVFSHALGPLAWGALDRLAASCTVAVPDWERSTTPRRAMAGLDWFPELAAELGFTRATLCAWSMAGPAAIHFAAERPPSLSHLVLVDVAGFRRGLPPLAWSDLPHLLLTKLCGHPTRGFVRRMWASWIHRVGVDTRELEAATYRFFRRGVDDPTDGEDGEDDETVLHVLPRIDVPTLVLSGRHSSVMGPTFGRTAAAVLPRGEHVEFEDSSHALQIEEPDRFQDEVAAFLAARGR